MKQEHINTALIALAAFAICKFVQKLVPIPVIGPYLPGGRVAGSAAVAG